MTELWMPQIDALKCTGCGECITACPTSALGRRAEKAALMRPDACTYCAACEDLCPVDAITLPYLIVKEAIVKEADERIIQNAE